MANNIRIFTCQMNNLIAISEIYKIYIALFRTGIEIKAHPYGGGQAVKYGIINAILFIIILSF